MPSGINVVVVQLGGAWDPFGDITTLMVWTAGKGEFVDFLAHQHFELVDPAFAQYVSCPTLIRSVTR